jgi:hypothetical protein
MGLLDGDIASLFSAALSGIYLDAELHRATVGADDGAGGGDGNGFADPEDVKAQLDVATQAMRETQGYVDTDVRILVLAHGVTTPTTDDEITIRGVRYGIRNVGTDPAQSYWDLHGRLAGNAEEAS